MNATAIPAPDRFRRWQRQCLLLGVVALAACCAHLALALLPSASPDASPGWNAADFYPFLQAYLMAYVFWAGISVGCLALAMLHQLVHGTWGLPTSRLYEAGGATLPAVALAFIPLALGVGVLYPWAYDAELQHEFSPLKAGYLSETGFILRSIGYLAVWLVLSWTLRRWTLRRDQHGATDDDERPTRGLRRLSAGGLVALGLTFTFAAVDWMMSLEPLWYSTIYGAIVALGALLTAFAFVLTVLARVDQDDSLQRVVSPSVYNDLGNLLLAFVILFAYLSYSQYLIIWSGNTVEEIDWYLRRMRLGWEGLALVLIGLHFVLPFLLLLSKQRKRRASSLAAVAAGLLLINYLHVVWLLAPAFRAHQFYRIRGLALRWPMIHWLDLVMPLALGGLWMAVFFWQARRRPLVSPSDPAWSKLEAHAGGHHA